jgi:hypothetical protein
LATNPGRPKSLDQRLTARADRRGGERKPVLKRWNQEDDADDQYQGGDA